MAGTADLLGTLADGEGDGRADLYLAARGGLGLDGLAGGDRGVGLLLGGAHDEAGGRDGGVGVGLGEALDLGHEGDACARGDVQRDLRAERDSSSAAGTVLMATPAATFSLLCSMVSPTTSPASSMAATASASERSRTAGTVTFGLTPWLTW